MSRNPKLGLVAAAVVVAVVAFVLLRPDDDKSSKPAEPAGATTTRTQGRGADTTTTPAKPEDEPKSIELADGEPVGGARTLTYEPGEKVDLVVKSDTAEELHLHGYDITKQVGPGEAAHFAFDADLEGVFELETHGSHAQVASIEVAP